MGIPVSWINTCSSETDIVNLISLFLNKKIREESHSSENTLVLKTLNANY